MTFIIAASRADGVAAARAQFFKPTSPKLVYVTNGLTAAAKLARFDPRRDTMIVAGLPVHEPDRSEMLRAATLNDIRVAA